MKIYSEFNIEVKSRACGHAQNRVIRGVYAHVRTHINLNPNTIIMPGKSRILCHDHFETKFVKIYE